MEHKSPDIAEKRHIAFLKVHKAASSTIQNIFLRFGTKRNMTFVLPSVGAIYPNVISTHETVNGGNIRTPPPSRAFDILCMHVLYNRTAFAAILQNDTVYVGSIRDPFDYFVSFLEFFREIHGRFNISGPGALTDFLEDPEKHDITISNPTSALYGFTKNRFAIEYGFSKELITKYDRMKVLEIIAELDKEFSLVIIVEHFDESIILLKRILKWKTKDVLYISKNSRNDELLKIGPRDRERYRKLSPIDYDLYEHFYLKLWRQIQLERRFHEEVLHFKMIRRDVVDYCLDMKKNSSELVINETEWHEAFLVTVTDCHYFLLNEIEFVNLIAKNQYGDHVAS